VGELTGLFDGIAPIGDALVVTDIRGTLWRVDADGAAVTLADLAQFNLGSANDFGVRPDTRTLMVADLGSNALWSLQLD
jgi:sugar lactone lactonase YvrE